jgi:hypothetical protein
VGSAIRPTPVVEPSIRPTPVVGSAIRPVSVVALGSVAAPVVPPSAVAIPVVPPLVPVVTPVLPGAEPAPVTAGAVVAAIIPVAAVLPVEVTGLASAVTSSGATAVGAVARAELPSRTIRSRPTAVGIRAARFSLVGGTIRGSGRLAAEAAALAATCRLLATSPVV